MISNQMELRKRGMPLQDDLERMKELSFDQLRVLLNHNDSAIRSATVIAMRVFGDLQDREYVSMLMECLSCEQALYTKIELSNSLELGKEETAIWMCEYLGTIGTNQHTCVPNAVSKKKSYPLPRDIVARILGKMNDSVLACLVNQLPSIDIPAKYELIDAIGFGVFYHRNLSTMDNFRVIYNTYNEFSEDELIVWKLALCCSAFPIPNSIEMLKDIIDSYENTIICAEAKRSITLLENKLR